MVVVFQFMALALQVKVCIILRKRNISLFPPSLVIYSQQSNKLHLKELRYRIMLNIALLVAETQ